MSSTRSTGGPTGQRSEWTEDWYLVSNSINDLTIGAVFATTTTLQHDIRIDGGSSNLDFISKLTSTPPDSKLLGTYALQDQT